MKHPRLVVGTLVLGGSALVAACSTTPNAQPAPAPSNPAPTGATPSSTTPSSTTPSAAAVNVAVSDQIRAQLVATGAALNGIPPSQYTGLAPGLTYYALDETTKTYWAGARLVPAPSSNLSSPTRAQISSQDAGAYYLFKRPQSGSWTAYPAGNTGPGSSCPISVPAAVVGIWGWPAGSCRPSGA
jgi:hypothetical protein